MRLSLIGVVIQNTGLAIITCLHLWLFVVVLSLRLLLTILGNIISDDENGEGIF